MQCSCPHPTFNSVSWFVQLPWTNLSSANLLLCWFLQSVECMKNCFFPTAFSFFRREGCQKEVFFIAISANQQYAFCRSSHDKGTQQGCRQNNGEADLARKQNYFSKSLLSGNFFWITAPFFASSSDLLRKKRKRLTTRFFRISCIHQLTLFLHGFHLSRGTSMFQIMWRWLWRCCHI